MGRVRYLPAAADDLEAIDIYLSQFDPLAAWRTIELIRSRARRLLEMPERGRTRSELGVGIRSLPIGKYVLFYRIDRSNIEIVRVLHGARDIRTLMRRG